MSSDIVQMASASSNKSLSSVLFWETDVCFLQTQHIGTAMQVFLECAIRQKHEGSCTVDVQKQVADRNRNAASTQTFAIYQTRVLSTECRCIP